MPFAMRPTKELKAGEDFYDPERKDNVLGRNKS